MLRAPLGPPHTDPATEELIPPAGGLEEPTGEEVKVGGGASQVPQLSSAVIGGWLNILNITLGNI